mmetsp:Transcript_13325/g.25007  ORF Transcript_13325/g.25007 Transcript_13325/m.25007 type:complete len:366 (-) Transcript_13325:84-1181(-)
MNQLFLVAVLLILRFNEISMVFAFSPYARILRRQQNIMNKSTYYSSQQTNSIKTAFSRMINKRKTHHDRNINHRKTHLKMVDMISPIQFVTQTYSSALLEHPLLTKATTGFFLCGLGDILAQIRGFQSSLQEGQQVKQILERMNWLRLARFAVKGFFGTCIWALWYDLSDSILSEEKIVSFIVSIVGFSDISDALLNAIRTVILILAEQFITCPIIYGFWEIPMSTLLNGAPASRITYEVKDKLFNMLFENAKVWTVANILIYNVPLQYRTGLANIMDVIWQSIVSDFAANCGKNIESVRDNEAPNKVKEEMVVVMREVVSVPPTQTTVVISSIVDGAHRTNYDDVMVGDDISEAAKAIKVSDMC